MREAIVLEVLSREEWWVEKRRKEYRRPRIGSLMHTMVAIGEKSNCMRVNDSGFVKEG